MFLFEKHCNETFLRFSKFARPREYFRNRGRRPGSYKKGTSLQYSVKNNFEITYFQLEMKRFPKHLLGQGLIT